MRTFQTALLILCLAALLPACNRAERAQTQAEGQAVAETGTTCDSSLHEVVDLAFATIHDDITLAGEFTSHNGTFEVLVEDPALHACALNRSGLAYGDYASVLAAWHSTADFPEGAVYVTSDFDYSFMVGLPIFGDHPMWGGTPPAAPGDDGNEQDHAWNAAAQDALDAWLAAQ